MGRLLTCSQQSSWSVLSLTFFGGDKIGWKTETRWGNKRQDPWIFNFFLLKLTFEGPLYPASEILTTFFGSKTHFLKLLLLKLTFWRTPLFGVRDFDDLFWTTFFLLKFTFFKDPFVRRIDFYDLFCCFSHFCDHFLDFSKLSEKTRLCDF